MNKQSLYLVGGALLATTALSTSSQAGTFKLNQGNGGTVATTAITAAPLATQVFAATTTTANSVSIGAGTTTSAGSILVDFAGPLVSTFDMEVSISTNAAFSLSPAPTIIAYGQSATGSTTTGTLITASSLLGCTVQPTAEKLVFSACNPANVSYTGQVGTTHIDALAIVGLQYTQASDLRTAGNSITLTGIVTNTSHTTTFETITAAKVVTSKSVGSPEITSNGATTIDNNASPVFAKLVSSAVATTTTATIGSIHFTSNLAVGTDLSNVFSGALSIVSTGELKVAHTSLTDTATTRIELTGVATVTSTQFIAGTATFAITGTILAAAPSIVLNFDGTTAIKETVGTPSGTVTVATGTTGIVVVPAAASGALSSLTRGGLSVELNTVLPGSMKASYISFLRIANQSSVASQAVITVRNDATGALVGTFLTDSIPAGGLGQINSVDIDTKLTTAGATLLTTAYKVTVSGSFNGYVQSLLYNVKTEVFADASGFRNGSLTLDP